MNSTVTFGELWHHLSEQGLVDPNAPEEVDEESTSMPWYISALVGISGWFAAAFLIGFLGALELIDTDTSTLVIGVVFCAVALGLKYSLGHAIFPNQLAFALSLAGQGLVIGSRFGSDEVMPIVVTVLILEGLLFILYPNGLHRLLSLAAIIVAMVVQLVDWELGHYIPWLALALAGLALLIWRSKNALMVTRLRAFFGPLSIGFPVAALGLCILQLMDVGFADGQWWIVAVGSGLLLLLLGSFILQGLNLSVVSPSGFGILVVTALLLIPAFQTPGVTVAALIFGLAYWNRDWLLMGLGIIGFTLFIIFYYYNLDLTLLTKSVILMGSGIGLLGLRLMSRWLNVFGEERGI